MKALQIIQIVRCFLTLNQSLILNQALPLRETLILTLPFYKRILILLKKGQLNLFQDKGSY